MKRTRISKILSIALLSIMIASWLVILILHLWLHLPDLPLGIMAGGSDSGMWVAKIDVGTSFMLVTMCLLLLLLMYFPRSPTGRATVVAFYFAATILSFLSGRVVSQGGVRGGLAFAVGWFMIPTEVFDISLKDVEEERGPFRSVDEVLLLWTAEPRGMSEIIFTSEHESFVIWTGPFIQAEPLVWMEYFTGKRDNIYPYGNY